MRILVSSICFVNRNRPGAEIYAIFAKRLINDIMTKTVHDIMITTNEIEHFNDEISQYGERIIIREEKLENHILFLGVFNQLLKFYTIKNIDPKYDWVLYLDCDAGLTGDWNNDEITSTITNWKSLGYDMMGTRTNAIVGQELKKHEELDIIHKNEIANGNLTHYNPRNLFSDKFIFYNVSTQNGPFEWLEAMMPSEHVLLIKNNDKLQKMADIFEDFCYKFETQDKDFPITVDMEAFEIGVSAKLAGYNMGDFGNYGLYVILKVQCNHNNWEKKKY